MIRSTPPRRTQNRPYLSTPMAPTQIAQSSRYGPRTTFVSNRASSSECNRVSTSSRSGCETPKSCPLSLADACIIAGA